MKRWSFRPSFFTLWDSGVKRSIRQWRLVYGTKKLCRKTCFAIVRSIPMSLLRRKSCSALASTILESPLHRTKATCTIFFCAICQAALQGRPFDTRILIGKSFKFHMVKRNNRTAAEGEYVAAATRRRRRIL